MAQVFKRKALTGTVRMRAGSERVVLTHADKVYWPGEGYTKADLARYYWQTAKFGLPYLKDRPQILKRFPNGIAGPSFHQHDVKDVPGYVKTVALTAENGREIDYVICNDIATMLYLVNLGNLGFHPWNARLGQLDHPDWVVFDLDPGDGTPFEVTCEVGMAVKDVLDRLGMTACAKTSGGRGLHVYVPIRAEVTAETAAGFAQRVAALVVAENPNLATLQRPLGKRPPKTVYVDHLQNATGKSVAAAYSARAKPGATVSAPLSWAEVKRGTDPEAYTIKTMPRRLAQKGDLFRPVLRAKQSLPAALRRLEKVGAG
jgi:bifunctional non-homologous end joining protein LigD